MAFFFVDFDLELGGVDTLETFDALGVVVFDFDCIDSIIDIDVVPFALRFGIVVTSTSKSSSSTKARFFVVVIGVEDEIFFFRPGVDFVVILGTFEAGDFAVDVRLPITREH